MFESGAAQDDPISAAFRSGIKSEGRPDFRDPMDPKYFGPLEMPWEDGPYGTRMPAPEDKPSSGAPLWARFAWSGRDGYVNPERDGASARDRMVNLTELVAERKAFYVEQGIYDFEPGAGLVHDGCEMAAVGAKGSGKSFTFGMACLLKIQKSPGIKIGLVANSYDQAYGSGAEKLVKVARGLGLRFIHRGEMMIDGFKHRNVYYFPDFDAKVCVLSFDNIDLIEGTEWDGFWFEEIQDCDEKDVRTAMSRARRGVCPQFYFFAGMPDDEHHWMYEFFERRHIPLYEPPLLENTHNLPSSYIANLRRIYSGSDADRYIEGKRVALFKQKVVPAMRWDLHVKGLHEQVEGSLSERLCTYDPYRRLYIAIDFNVAPMCAIAVQVKEWDFERGGEPARKPIICQVDEWELWNATTAAMIERILYGDHERPGYEDHPVGGVILGDATGNRRDTRSPGETDWTIIKKAFAPLNGFAVLPGLIRSRKKKRRRGERLITYANPPVRETVVCLNGLMVDGDGDPGFLFLPESRLPSGGAARAVADAKFDMTSKIDDANDKSDDPKVPRTHFVDDCRYVAYYLNGKMGHPSREQVGSQIGKARSATHVSFVIGS